MLATLAAPAFWEEADTTVRGDVSECVNAVHGDLDDARTRIYRMTYGEWKSNYQTEATPEQLAAIKAIEQ